MSITLPIHPVTGLQAIGYTSRGPVWPALGGSGEGGSGSTEGTETGADGNGDGEKPTETVEFWKTKAREQEKRAKENASAATELAKIQDAQKSDAEKAADRIKNAEAEVASVPAKVADGLREHLVKLHGIDAEDAELFLTATDPEKLLKQIDRLVGQKATRKKNHVPREGQSTTSHAEDPLREFTRSVFQSGE